MTKIISFIAFFMLLFCTIALSQNIKGIAPEFSTFKGILLIAENETFKDNILNRKTEKRFEKDYKGEWEMINISDLNTRQYSNTTKYRFVIQMTVWGFAESPLYTFIMTDRLTDTNYETKSYNFLNVLLGNYTESLEKVRSKDSD
jgi:hypothetical protein